MTNHSYFNLGGHGNEKGVLNHTMEVNADFYTPYDERSIPYKTVKSLDDDKFMRMGKDKTYE